MGSEDSGSVDSMGSEDSTGSENSTGSRDFGLGVGCSGSVVVAVVVGAVEDSCRGRAMRSISSRKSAVLTFGEVDSGGAKLSFFFGQFLDRSYRTSDLARQILGRRHSHAAYSGRYARISRGRFWVHFLGR